MRRLLFNFANYPEESIYHGESPHYGVSANDAVYFHRTAAYRIRRNIMSGPLDGTGAQIVSWGEIMI